MNIKYCHDGVVIKFKPEEHDICIATIQILASMLEECDAESSRTLLQTADELDKLEAGIGHA